MELKRSSVVTFFDFNVSFVRHELQSWWTMLDAIVILNGSDGAKNRSTTVFTRSKIKVYLRFAGLSVLKTSANTFQWIFNSKLIVFL